MHRRRWRRRKLIISSNTLFYSIFFHCIFWNAYNYVCLCILRGNLTKKLLILFIVAKVLFSKFARGVNETPYATTTDFRHSCALKTLKDFRLSWKFRWWRRYKLTTNLLFRLMTWLFFFFSFCLYIWYFHAPVDSLVFCFAFKYRIPSSWSLNKNASTQPNFYVKFCTPTWFILCYFYEFNF